MAAAVLTTRAHVPRAYLVVIHMPVMERLRGSFLYAGKGMLQLLPNLSQPMPSELHRSYRFSLCSATHAMLFRSWQWAYSSLQACTSPDTDTSLCTWGMHMMLQVKHWPPALQHAGVFTTPLIPQPQVPVLALGEGYQLSRTHKYVSSAENIQKHLQPVLT